MLSACGGSAARIDPAPVAHDPVVEIRREVVIACPAELLNAPAGRPQPDPGAVVEYNAAGGDWLARLIGWGEAAVQTVVDARAQCPETDRPAAEPAEAANP